jgi:hypothetical protein
VLCNLPNSVGQPVIAAWAAEVIGSPKSSKVSQVRTLSHYTSLQGFKGIIEDSTFWASNVSFLNDRSELIHGLDSAFRAITRFVNDGRIDLYIDEILSVINEFKGGGVPDACAVCFCANPDKLSLWRAYSGSSQGISLVFDRSRLEEALTRPNNNKYIDESLERVEYTDALDVSKISDQIVKMINSSLLLQELFASSSEPDRNHIRFYLSSLFPKFKHIGFKDESEWRFVKIVDKDVAYKYRIYENRIIPYIDVVFDKRKIPLTRVCVGPGVEPDITAAGVKSFLIAHGYRDVEVVKSEIPYRPSIW